MFETEKTGGVLIHAFCEWWPVNQEGKEDENGEYAFINEMWVHEAHRGNGVLRRVLHKAAQRYPQIKHLFFHHRKYANRHRQYTRKQLKEEL